MKEYTCGNCHGTFRSDRSDEDAAAEYERMRPQYAAGADQLDDPCDLEDTAIVCDDCFKQMAQFYEWAIK